MVKKMTIVLSNEFDTYLVPSGEPEHKEYVSRCEEEIKTWYPMAEIEYRSDGFKVEGAEIDGLKAEAVMLDLTDIFNMIYDEMAYEAGR